MKMTKLFLFGFAFALALNVQAQDSPATTPSKQEQAEMRVRKERPANSQGKSGQAAEKRQDLMGKLNLSDEQKAQFKAINEKYRSQMSEFRANSPEKTVANRQAMEAIQANKLAELKGILSAEQFEIFQAETSQKQGPQKGQRGGNGKRAGNVEGGR